MGGRTSFCQESVSSDDRSRTPDLTRTSPEGAADALFRLDTDKVGTLDTLAGACDCDPTYLLNEAVSAYLDAQQWHVEQIKAGLRQADTGELIDHTQIRKRVGKMVAKRRRR